MTYKDIVCNKEILEYYKRGSAILDELGYTDHSTAHTKLVCAGVVSVRKTLCCLTCTTV